MCENVITHDKLLNATGKRINDERFLEVIEQFLRTDTEDREGLNPRQEGVRPRFTRS